MSHVSLLAADRPLPLYDSGIRRTERVTSGGYTVTFETPGVRVLPLDYWRGAVDDLGFAIKPCRCELDLRCTEEDAGLLREYLERSCVPGERVELWNLWVGDGSDRPVRYSGRLADLGLDTLVQLRERYQTCMTIQR